MQAAGHSYLSRITAFLDEILSPISMKYCQLTINEYCRRDTKSYINTLSEWKNRNSAQNHVYITAADVKALYPNLSRELIQNALEQCSSNFWLPWPPKS